MSGLQFPHGVWEGIRCPNCGAEPLRCSNGHCEGCGHELRIVPAAEVE